jgi:hypothetical protein
MVRFDHREHTDTLAVEAEILGEGLSERKGDAFAHKEPHRVPGTRTGAKHGVRTMGVQWGERLRCVWRGVCVTWRVCDVACVRRGVCAAWRVCDVACV